MRHPYFRNALLAVAAVIAAPSLYNAGANLSTLGLPTEVMAQQHLLEIPHPNGGALAAFVLGAAEGADYQSLVCNGCDLRGWRNMQGGSPADPNFDVSAGGDGAANGPRGKLALNYDNGSQVGIFDGKKRPMIVVNEQGVRIRGRDGKLRWVR